MLPSKLRFMEEGHVAEELVLVTLGHVAFGGEDCGGRPCCREAFSSDVLELTLGHVAVGGDAHGREAFTLEVPAVNIGHVAFEG
jgi:hypothetical protein